jgi:hypothetical protein
MPCSISQIVSGLVSGALGRVFGQRPLAARVQHGAQA